MEPILFTDPYITKWRIPTGFSKNLASNHMSQSHKVSVSQSRHFIIILQNSNKAHNMFTWSLTGLFFFEKEDNPK